MLDLIIGPFLEYSPLGDLNKTSVDGKDEFWYNSKVDITFGDTTTWLIGLGRITNVCGPDLKIIADWTFFIDKLMGKVASKLPKTKKYLDVLSGTGGSTDVIFGVKDLINYGHTQDTNIIRKNTAPLEIKIFKDKLKPGESLFPKALIALIVLPYLTLLTIVVTSRFAFMQVGIFSEEKLREQVKGALNLSAPLIESRWVACLKLYEKLTYTSDQLKKTTEKLKTEANKLANEVNKNAKKLKAQASNILINSELQKAIGDHTQIVRDYINGSKKVTEEIATKAVDALKISAPFLGEPSQEIIKSNTGLDSTYNSLSYNAVEKIKLNVSGKSDSVLELTPDKINLQSKGVALNLGKIGDVSGMVDISFSSPDGVVKLGGTGDSLSHMTINNESLVIQSGKTNTKNPTIKLSEGQLELRCGPAITNPEIVIENDKVTIRVGATGLGSSFVMTDDSIELKVGPLSTLSMTKSGTILKSGLGSSTKWDATGISMSVGENAIKLGLADLKKQAIMLKENIDAVAKVKSVLSNLDVSAIDNLKAALRNL